jgi:hypothetical protein
MLAAAFEETTNHTREAQEGRQGGTSIRAQLVRAGTDVSGGAFLGIAAQFVVAIGVIFYMLPWMVLDTARAVAEFDLPMRVLGLWWGNP